MRRVKYRDFDRWGPKDGRKKATLVEFIADLGGLFAYCWELPLLIPPLTLVNEKLASGKDFSGDDGHTWDPFQISEDEWREVVTTLQQLPDRHYAVVEPPTWVTTLAEWDIWIQEVRLGVPSDQHRPLDAKYRYWEKKRDDAQQQGDQARVLEYHVKTIKAGQKLVDLTTPYLDRYREKRKKR
jgi:hypothetical protein